MEFNTNYSEFFFDPTCISAISISNVSLRHGQFLRPRVSVTAGKLKAQCRTISVSIVWALAGSVMDI